MGDDLYVYFGSQIRVIILSFIFGLFLAAVYDGVRILRTFLGCGVQFAPFSRPIRLPLLGELESAPKAWTQRTLLKTANVTSVLIFDLIYSIFAVMAILLFLYAAEDGIVRSYSILSMAAAFVLYMKTVAMLTGKTAGAIIFTFRVLFAYVVFFTVRPIAFLLKRAMAAALFLYSLTVGRCILKYLTKRANKKENEYFDGHFKEIKESIKSAISDDKSA